MRVIEIVNVVMLLAKFQMYIIDARVYNLLALITHAVNSFVWPAKKRNPPVKLASAYVETADRTIFFFF